MDIISRRQWGALNAAAYQNRNAPLPAQRVWLHHSATIAPNLVPPFDDDDAAVRTLERIGQQRFGWGISYTFVVTPVGRVYEGHRVDGLGAHTGGDNTNSRAICLIGNYDNDRPTGAQLAAVAELLRHGKQAGWWRIAALTGGHRDAPGASTACPGRHAHALIAEINRLAAAPAPREDPDAMSWFEPSVPDYYRSPGEKTQRRDLPSPREALAFATLHAANARDRATEATTMATLARDEAFTARQELAALRGELAKIRELLLAQPAPAQGDPRAFAAAVAADLAARLTG